MPRKETERPRLGLRLPISARSAAPLIAIPRRSRTTRRSVPVFQTSLGRRVGLQAADEDERLVFLDREPVLAEIPVDIAHENSVVAS